MFDATCARELQVQRLWFQHVGVSHHSLFSVFWIFESCPTKLSSFSNNKKLTLQCFLGNFLNYYFSFGNDIVSRPSKVLFASPQDFISVYLRILPTIKSDTNLVLQGLKQFWVNVQIDKCF